MHRTDCMLHYLHPNKRGMRDLGTSPFKAAILCASADPGTDGHSPGGQEEGAQGRASDQRGAHRRERERERKKGERGRQKDGREGTRLLSTECR